MVKEKQKLTLSVDKEVVDKAKKLGINISEITEKVLVGYTSAEKPDGSLYDAYKQLFDSILPLLKEFDCNVKIAEGWEDVTFEDPEGNEVEDSFPQDSTYLTAEGSFLVEPTGPDPYHIYDIKKIPRREFLEPQQILENLVNELVKRQERRKKKNEEILMAKRIIDAMSERLLKKQSAK